MAQVENGHFTHFSPEPTLLHAPVSDVAAITRSVAARMLKNASGHAPTREITFGPDPLHAEPEDIAELRPEIIKAFPDLRPDFTVRIRVVDNAASATQIKEQFPGYAGNNWHTDFWVDMRSPDIQFRPRDFARRVLILDGNGSRALSGTVQSESVQSFSANRFNDRPPEHQMASMDLLLTGSAGQLIRGPVGSDITQGDFEVIEIPSEEWYGVDPSGIHTIPDTLHRGRAVINVDEY